MDEMINEVIIEPNIIEPDQEGFVTDRHGKWEIKTGNGCMNKILVEPSEEYLAEIANVPKPPKTTEERLKALETVVLKLGGII